MDLETIDIPIRDVEIIDDNDTHLYMVIYLPECEIHDVKISVNIDRFILSCKFESIFKVDKLYDITNMTATFVNHVLNIRIPKKIYPHHGYIIY